MFSNNSWNIGTCPETVAKWKKDSETSTTITYKRSYTAPDTTVVDVDFVTICKDKAWIRVTADYILNDQQQPIPPFSFGTNQKGPTVEVFQIGHPAPLLTLTSDIVNASDTTIDFTTNTTAHTTAKATFTMSSTEATAFAASTSGTVNQTSTAVDATKYKWIGLQFLATSLNTADGVIKLQDSIDGTNYNDIAGATITVGSGTSSNMIRYTAHTGKYIRAVWTKGTNTTGTIQSFWMLKP